jgi:hypothetical protein
MTGKASGASRTGRDALIETGEKWLRRGIKNLFRVKYDPAPIGTQSISQYHFRKCEKSFIRRLRIIFRRLCDAL